MLFPIVLRVAECEMLQPLLLSFSDLGSGALVALSLKVVAILRFFRMGSLALTDRRSNVVDYIINLILSLLLDKSAILRCPSSLVAQGGAPLRPWSSLLPQHILSVRRFIAPSLPTTVWFGISRVTDSESL